MDRRKGRDMTPSRTKSIIEGFAIIAAGLIPIMGMIWVLAR